MTTNPRLRFPRDARVCLRGEFDRVFQGGKRVTDNLLSVYWRTNEHSPRLGLTVSRKVDRRAVGRNRIKRVFREVTRRLRPQLAGGDYVIVARSAAAAASTQQLALAYLRLLGRLGALPVSIKGGTMPPVFITPDFSGSVPEFLSGPNIVQ